MVTSLVRWKTVTSQINSSKYDIWKWFFPWFKYNFVLIVKEQIIKSLEVLQVIYNTCSERVSCRPGIFNSLCGWEGYLTVEFLHLSGILHLYCKVMVETCNWHSEIQIRNECNEKNEENPNRVLVVITQYIYSGFTTSYHSMHRNHKMQVMQTFQHLNKLTTPRVRKSQP